ncbi:hypothetical protein METBIDRAFT_76789 [Metschnikowia bicuspidata var. bicuspidata NRRL YB-4993]|uniref:Amino acid transporter transmembrane domain-containing protein n=1 Tax=Metschnikowia bicuspidata var. bicuspidata NRRL YB-4993 TaxID=869754 RepID=A0A1A0HIZ1_9ASCO|nr:hypothetical protein METBIDRAFT_76789 [Metschnikowia bicuspidata var. bicuspidata NRRL YB-4993]OBA23852.1 hypothetical protein METBIDRAFT_76789 [Metschnikowia bicuspidata var. bicuspidata NRRL YB-4993]
MPQNSQHSAPQAAARRPSFLDYGGANSLNNFASSLQRALMYLEVTLPETAAAIDNISPCTSRASSEIRDIELGLLCPDNGMGRSTAPQTVFNAINTLMGIAMLSLPFGLRLSGWVPGVMILGLCACITSKTAKVLGSVLRKHRHVHSYADIAYLYGGSKFLAFATGAFVLDLMGALLSLVLIFSDSFATLLPNANRSSLKLAITGVTLVFSFLPLSLVSVISLVGIVCTVGIFATIVFCGLIASGLPVSLLYPAHTSLWPSSGTDLLLSLGIFMAPWGGHPVFPELYRDMRHPSKYNKSCTAAFLATILLNLLIATAGYVMFGDAAEDSVTKNIIAQAEYPGWVRTVICVILGVLPACKLALVTRPVISVYESQLSLTNKNTATPLEPAKLTLRQCLARVVFMAFLFTLSIAFTSFGNVVAFLGSAICFTICVTLPLLFHLKLNADELTPFLTVATKAGVAVGILGAILGTYGSLVSKP